MKPETIYKALEHTSDEYIVSAHQAMEQGRRRMGIRRTLLMAACITLAVAMVAIPIGMLKKDTPPTVTTPVEKLPSRTSFSAYDIATIFAPPLYDGPTQKYQTIYVPSSEYLPLSPLSEKTTLPVYQYDYTSSDMDKEEFDQFVSDILPRFCKAAGFDLPSYEIERKSTYYEATFNYNAFSRHNGAIWQNTGVNGFSVDVTTKFQLDGIPVVVDQTQSDEEIIASLKSLKHKLFEIFGESFSDVKIVREYDNYNPYGVDRLCIYFYNKSDNPLNTLMKTPFGSIYHQRPFSDYITLEFDDSSDHEGDRLSKVCIEYSQCRKAYEVCSTPFRAISLEQAEEYLDKGYIFSFHVCDLCQAQQKPVDFENYDFVTIAYQFGSANEDFPYKAVPFYVFYKYIGNSKNGNQTYAYTHVPAIEIEGIEEYFQQLSNLYHPQATTQSPVTTAPLPSTTTASLTGDSKKDE